MGDNRINNWHNYSFNFSYFRKIKREKNKHMIITTSDQIKDREIKETLGLVRGNTVRAKNIGKDILAGLRNIVGGEIKEYTETISEAREIALAEMIEEAEKKGANAIVGVRFTTSQVMSGAAELLVYGTAVKLD